MELIFGFGLIAFFLILGFVVGGMNERKHLNSLDEREAVVRDILTTQLKSFPNSVEGSAPTMLIAESVISSDYLKTFLAGWKNFFGGEIRSFASIMERARREALVQLKEQAMSAGYNAICNIRLESADLAGRGSNQKNKIVVASIIASGTAYHAQTD